MSRNQRLSLLGLTVVVLVVAFIIARSGGDSGDKASSTTTTNGGSGGGTESNVVVVRNAKPVGGVQKLTYKKGGTIDFTVRSDTADEIHFHGYDIGKDVKAGGSVHFTTPAKIDGRFEVELQGHKEQIAEVEGEP